MKQKYQQNTIGNEQAGETHLNEMIFQNIQSPYLSTSKCEFHLHRPKILVLFLAPLLPASHAQTVSKSCLVLSSNILRINPLLTVFPSTHFLSVISHPDSALVSLIFPFPPMICSKCSNDQGPFKMLAHVPHCSKSSKGAPVSHRAKPQILKMPVKSFFHISLPTHTLSQVYSVPAMLTLMFLSHASHSCLGPLYSLCVHLRHLRSK